MYAVGVMVIGKPACDGAGARAGASVSERDTDSDIDIASASATAMASARARARAGHGLCGTRLEHGLIWIPEIASGLGLGLDWHRLFYPSPNCSWEPLSR